MFQRGMWFALILVAAGCSSTRERAGLLDDVGRFHRAVTTDSVEAQRLFDQGLLLCFAFDHEQAVRLFERALELDPECASAYWGIALASGPNINNAAMDQARSQAAYAALERARQLAAGANELEKALIEALSRRYAWPEPADRKSLDVDYANALRELWHAHPSDADLGALFAEALMDLRPWDLWSAQGEPRPETAEVLSTLEAVLALDANHPGGLHYTVHALEASPHPERALEAANRLRERVPGASHLVHMPSHIDIRVGNYLDAIVANQRAGEIDKQRVARVGPGGFYALYRAHNFHFLAWAAMFDGQSALALRAAREMVEQVPFELVRESPVMLDGFPAAPLHVLIRFGRWNEIVREPAPPSSSPTTTAMWRYARGLAHASLGDVAAAEREQAEFERACTSVPESYFIGNNPTHAVLDIARTMLAGELAYRRGDFDAAFEKLRGAVALDDALHYDEPWGWMQPARHALGALLVEQGRIDEAESVYRRDLERHPRNGWSLHGLEECLRRSGRLAEADETLKLFREAFQRADVELHGSCFCRARS